MSHGFEFGDVGCGVWAMECGVWGVRCGWWNVQCAMWNMERLGWVVECGVCRIWGVKSVWCEGCGVWGLVLWCRVWGVGRRVWAWVCFGLRMCGVGYRARRQRAHSAERLSQPGLRAF